MSRAFRLGLFIVLTLAIFATAIFLIGGRKFAFSGTYRVYAQFKNVAGLEPGAAVRVAGIHEGTVHSIELPSRPDGQARVALDLKNDTKGVIKKDSVASIAAEGLIGDMYVEVSFGSNDAPPVKDGDTIQGQPPLEMAGLLQKADGILDSAGEAMQNIDQTSSNLTAISAKMSNGQGTVGALLNDKSLYKRMDAAASSLQDDVDAVKHNFLLRGFFKKRGYENQDELTKYEIAHLPNSQPDKQFTYDAGKIFDKPTSAKLKNQKALDDAGKFLEQDSFGLVVIAAYAGMKGDTQKDRLLTEARALVVRDYLVQNFKLKDTRIKTLGLGKTDDQPDAGVSVMVFKPEAIPVHAASGAANKDNVARP